MKRIIFLFFILFCSVASVAGTPVFRLTDYKQHRPVENKFISVYKTFDTSSIDVFNLLKDSQHFIRYDLMPKNVSKNSVLWAKISIVNDTDYDFKGILMLGGKRDADFAEVWFFDRNDNLLKHSYSGYFLSNALKEIKIGHGAKVYLNIAKGDTITVLAKIYNISGFSPKYKIEIYDSNTFWHNIIEKRWLLGFFIGIMFIMFLYNFLYSFVAHEPTHRTYSLYIIGVILNISSEQGILKEFFIVDKPELNIYFFLIGTLLATTTYIQFIRRFIDTKNNSPNWDKVHRFFIFLMLMVNIFLFFIAATSYNIPLILTISNVINSLLMVYGIAFAIYLISTDHSLKLYFIIGTFFLTTGGLIFLASLLLGFKCGNLNCSNAMNMGILLEILMFSIGMGRKAHLVELEKIKSQERLIESYKKIKEIEENKNKELDRLVKERTKEIEEQKIEIMRQAEVLDQANKELEKLSLVASETDNAIMIIQNNGKIEWINPAFERMYNTNLADLQNKNLDNIFRFSTYKHIKKVFNHCVINKVSYTFVTNSLVERDGKETTFWLQATLTPIVDINGNVSKIISVESDITELKEIEAELMQQKEQMTEIAGNLTSSILYAKRIQSALMPTTEYFKQVFPDSFIYYKPKHIVSGDFYWVHKQGNRIFWVVADSTGHGVPGAFMSVLGISILNEIVGNIDNKHTSAAEILNALREKVISMLHQNQSLGTPFDSKDGIDMAFCIIDIENRILNYAGANIPFNLIRINSNNKKDYIIEKPDKMPIGIYFGDKRKKFTDYFIKITDSDIIYLYSDGFADQFGMKTKRKYMNNNLRKLLFSISHLNMEEQQRLIQSDFENWKGTFEQTDDVLVTAVSLKNIL